MDDFWNILKLEAVEKGSSGNINTITMLTIKDANFGTLRTTISDQNESKYKMLEPSHTRSVNPT